MLWFSSGAGYFVRPITKEHVTGVFVQSLS